MTTLLLLALALSMDAFAAAVSQGANARPAPTGSAALRLGLAFGAAQAVMPLLGWSLGLAFAPLIRQVDHWVAFGLLVLIGGHMLHEGTAARKEDRTPVSTPLASGMPLFALAVATSIDAAAAGLTLPLLELPVATACAVIGVVTVAMSTAGVLLGKAAGAMLGRRAEVLGGLVLIAIGIKILVDHVFLGGG